jgi:bleomycin hydrolase
MNGVLNQMMRYNAARLREMAAEGVSQEVMREAKIGMLKDTYRILALHLGIPPEEFVWRVKNKDDEIIEKKFTPRSFYKEAVGIDLRDYVTIMDHAAWDYYKHYRIAYCRNLYDEPDMNFINLPAEEFGTYTARAILENEPVWFAADIGKENNTDKGILRVGLYDYQALLGFEHELTKKEMVTLRHATANHAMVFVGVDRKDDRPVKWLVENSWGTDRGNKGYWTMYNDWFEKYVFTVIIHKRHLPKKVLDLLDIEPEIIPAWDPMRSAFDG